MALIKCEDCGKDISDKATSCINCGNPITIIEEIEEKQELAISMEEINELQQGQKKRNLFLGLLIFGIILFPVYFLGLFLIIPAILVRKKYNNEIKLFGDFLKTEEGKRYQKQITKNQDMYTFYQNEVELQKINTRIQDNKDNAIACCPQCGSTSLSAQKKGFGIGKALIGAWGFGLIGLTAGNIRAKKIRVTCMNCGKQFWAGKQK